MTRVVNLDFFQYQNHPYPPVNKSDLVSCLQDLVTFPVDGSSADVIILDGAAIIHLQDPRGATTFSQYAATIFLRYLQSQFFKVSYK